MHMDSGKLAVPASVWHPQRNEAELSPPYIARMRGTRLSSAPLWWRRIPAIVLRHFPTALWRSALFYGSQPTGGEGGYNRHIISAWVSAFPPPLALLTWLLQRASMYSNHGFSIRLHVNRKQNHMFLWGFTVPPLCTLSSRITICS
jgi:hypothetical protein